MGFASGFLRGFWLWIFVGFSIWSSSVVFVSVLSGVSPVGLICILFGERSGLVRLTERHIILRMRVGLIRGLGGPLALAPLSLAPGELSTRRPPKACGPLSPSFSPSPPLPPLPSLALGLLRSRGRARCPLPPPLALLRTAWACAAAQQRRRSELVQVACLWILMRMVFPAR